MRNPIKRLQNIENASFFCDLPGWCKLSTLFVRGDVIVLFPFLLVIGIIGFFSLQWMLVMFGIYIAVRYMGEMMYWLLQQFSDRKYRPYDFGFKKLDNNAIYIIYQTMSICWVTVGISIILASILYLK